MFVYQNTTYQTMHIPCYETLVHPTQYFYNIACLSIVEYRIFLFNLKCKYVQLVCVIMHILYIILSIYICCFLSCKWWDQWREHSSWSLRKISISFAPGLQMMEVESYTIWHIIVFKFLENWCWSMNRFPYRPKDLFFSNGYQERLEGNFDRATSFAFMFISIYKQIAMNI